MSAELMTISMIMTSKEKVLSQQMGRQKERESAFRACQRGLRSRVVRALLNLAKLPAAALKWRKAKVVR